MMEKRITIEIICSKANMFEAYSRLRKKVSDFKEYLFDICHVPANEQKLIYKGETLEDDRTLESYGLEEYHAIHMELPNNPWFTQTTTIPPSDTTSGGLMATMIMIDIICSNEDMFSVRSSVSAKVVDFKKLLAEIFYIPPNDQRLIYRGNTLEDDRTLDSYGLKEYHTIHLEETYTRPTQPMPETSLLLYPPISQMMRTLLSSPQLMNQIINQNERLRSMVDSNPELSDISQHHEVVRCLTSAQMMQASESQPRQTSIQHSTSSEDVAAGPSASFKAMVWLFLLRV